MKLLECKDKLPSTCQTAVKTIGYTKLCNFPKYDRFSKVCKRTCGNCRK